MENNFSYFQNKSCQYFPCHKCEGDFFNCMFCYCPLYALGEKCGGNFCYTNGIKDCSCCTLVHGPGGYQYVLSKFNEINELAKKKEMP